MNEEELKVWFLNKLNSCYLVKYDDYPDSIFLFYNKSYVRLTKLCEIIKQEILLPSTVNGVCLFEINLIHNMLYCDFKNIWNIMNYNYSNKYVETQSLIKGWLEKTDKFRIFTPTYSIRLFDTFLNDKNKLSVYNKSII